MFFLLLQIINSADNSPLNETTCTEGQYYSWYTLDCKTCPGTNQIVKDGSCACNDESLYIDPTTGNCVSCDSGKIFNNFCYDTNNFETTRNSITTYNSISVSFNKNKILSDRFVTATASVNQTQLDKLKDAYASCSLSNKLDQKSCELVANFYAYSSYRTDSLISQYTNIIQPTTGGQHGIIAWPVDEPFITYTISYQSALDDHYINSNFNYDSLITLYLAKFKADGTFIGLSEVTTDLNYCNETNRNSQLWRRFGTNFYSSCYFNLLNELTSHEDELFDLYIADGEINGHQILRPVPVLIRNYYDSSMGYVNSVDSSSSRYRLFRRFFVKDTFLTNDYIQYASDITLQLQIDDTDPQKMIPPVLIIEYEQCSIATLTTTATTQSELINSVDPKNITNDHEEIGIPSFSFNVLYTRDISSFWRSAIIALIVIFVLAFALWVGRSFIYAKNHKNDQTIVLKFITFFCVIFGYAILLLCFIMTFFFYFIFYKWQSVGYRCLPPEDELWLLSLFVWIGFGLLFIGSILHIFSQTNSRIFMIDWENPHKEGVSVSAWRRIMVSNEWNRIISIRSYSMSFTILFLLFLLEGFDLQLLASPIPRTDLIDVGITYKILRFAFTTFLWILLMIFEYIVNIIFWVIFGNPFLNFIDLCATSNISVLILSSPTTGFYIHGRSIHAHADDEMSKLHEQLTNEAKDNVGLRGLVQNTNDQVFHIYLSQNFGLSSKAMYEAIRQRYSKKAIAIAKAQNIRSKIEVEAMAAYNGLNQYFRRFFEASESEHKYIIQKESMMEKILDWGPQVNEETILTISGDYSYRKSLMCGIEWTLCAMCLLLFAGIEMETQSPTIAAFMTFIVDQILVRFFRYRAKRNLAEKAILDKKFLIS